MGRAQFDKPVNLRAQELTLIDSKISQAPVESVEYVDATQTGNVASGGSETTYIRPPAGYIYELSGVRLSVSADGDAATGNHNFELRTEAQQLGILFGKSSYNVDLTFRYGQWQSADVSKVPADTTFQGLAVRDMRIDENNGLQAIYSNNTDVAQENSRTFKVAVRKIKVA